LAQTGVRLQENQSETLRSGRPSPLDLLSCRPSMADDNRDRQFALPHKAQ